MNATCDGSAASSELIDTMETAPATDAATSRWGLTTTPESAKTTGNAMADTQNRPSPIAHDDSRHGTNPGYNAGCRDDCCRHAHMVWMKRYRLYGGRETVSAIGFDRRVRALQAIGYTTRTISEELGRSKSFVESTLGQERVRQATHDAMAEVFERLCMILPQGWIAERARRQAAIAGYPPPLAWDDVDDPDEVPQGAVRPTRKTDWCGTRAGYDRHLRRNEKSCEECREFWRQRRRQAREAA